ncbi:MAG: double-strand break repair helicase AddA [Alphaproteobacteria bacterium]
MTKKQSSNPRVRALDPAASVWVSASAGSGKTQLLTERVIRLMVGGAAPARILCLTFTRAAAAEMAQRINRTLALYATTDDATLDGRLAALLDRKPDSTERRRARELFARVLDVPGGMRIMTIHAFCQSLLRRFPIEADIAPHFDVLDEPGQRELLADAETRLFAEAGSQAGGPAARALERLIPSYDEARFSELIRSLRVERARLATARTAHGGIDGLIGALHERLGVPEGSDETRIVLDAAAESAFDRGALTHAAGMLARHGTTTDNERAARIAHWLSLDHAGRAAGFDDYLAAFLTQKLEPQKRLTTKAVDKASPETNEILSREQSRLMAVIERRRSAALAANTAAVLRVEARFDAIYAREKAGRAALDFDDQIEQARALLEEKGAGAWVLYKLDGGLDHILLDEAQDTAPAQWRVIAALAAEFFAGLGAREAARTVFAVGDEKQSIFSFQGADLKALLAERDRLIARASDAGLDFHDVPLVRSFRSTAPVLALTDAVFAPEETRAGVTREGEPLRHTLVREGQAGLVELWPMIEPEDAEAPDPFDVPLRHEAEDDPEARLADCIAHRILRWLRPRDAAEREEATLPARGRRLRPGDIMVLVRHRTGFVPHLVAQLKSHGVPVAGVDRMVITEQLAVMDLMALGRAALLPQDDLNLACVLKSPLIGFDDDRLFALAYRREGRLWQALTERRDGNAAFAEAHGALTRLFARADYLPPFELFAGLLAEGGRARLLRRLGPEANDAIDEFLSLALDYERDHAPSLQGFLHWLETGQSEIKRDLEQGRDEVRVMTVHGAKGLQAPVVILPDTVSMPNPRPGLLWTEGRQGAPALPLFPARVANLDAIGEAAYAAAKQADDEEYRRLLYVALTRAEDRLYVGGARGRQKASDDCWYRLIEQGFGRLAPVEQVPLADGLGGVALRHASAQTRDPDKADPAVAAPAEAPPLPAWARTPPPPEPKPARALAPSGRFEAELRPLSPLGPEGGSARRRGRLIHRLLELMPEIAPEARDAAIERYLARASLGLPEAERADIAERVRRVLADPEIAPLLGPDSLAEVPLSAEIDGALVAGRVDRLAIGPERITVLDYKTGATIPESPAEVPPAYAAQLAAYRAVLSRAFPGRRIACGLVFTDGPAVHWLTDSVLDAFAP